MPAALGAKQLRIRLILAYIFALSLLSKFVLAAAVRWVLPALSYPLGLVLPEALAKLLPVVPIFIFSIGLLFVASERALLGEFDAWKPAGLARGTQAILRFLVGLLALSLPLLILAVTSAAADWLGAAGNPVQPDPHETASFAYQEPRCAWQLAEKALVCTLVARSSGVGHALLELGGVTVVTADPTKAPERQSLSLHPRNATKNDLFITQHTRALSWPIRHFPEMTSVLLPERNDGGLHVLELGRPLVLQLRFSGHGLCDESMAKQLKWIPASQSSPGEPTPEVQGSQLVYVRVNAHAQTLQPSPAVLEPWKVPLNTFRKECSAFQ